MASAKDTPRQKMIGMMYLVLTALLALNVSKDILDAFIVVNKGLENTNNNFTDRNENLYVQFDLAKSVDPVLVTPNWEKAQVVKKHSAEICNYIEQLQKKLIAQTDGIEQSVADTIQMANLNSKDNYDTPTNILIGDSEDGSAGASRELKNKLVEYRTKLSSYILPADRNKVKVDINTEAPEHHKGNENWEMYNFYHRPLVASITILSKLKSDVKNSESLVVDYLLKQNDVAVMKFDTVAAKVIPQSNYVLLGEEYKADVFIAAFSKTKKPEVLVENNSIEVEKGLGKYSVKTSKEGIVSYSGTIKLRSPQGKLAEFPFKSEYIVARPSLTVSADKMNVVYLGLDNPISVSVPGIPNERLTVAVTNASLKSDGNGKYIMKVNNGPEVKVNVFASMGNGEKRNMGTMSFRVRRVPKPVAKIGQITTEGKMSKSEFNVLQIISAYYENFEFNAQCKVLSYDMIYTVGGTSGSKSVVGNTIDQSLKDLFSKLRRNDRVYFENIKAKGPDGISVPLSPIKLKVN
jgi:gliding motility-associated protein GldM